MAQLAEVLSEISCKVTASYRGMRGPEYLQMHVYLRAYIHTCIHMHVCMYVYIYIYIYDKYRWYIYVRYP